MKKSFMIRTLALFLSVVVLAMSLPLSATVATAFEAAPLPSMSSRIGILATITAVSAIGGAVRFLASSYAANKAGYEAYKDGQVPKDVVKAAVFGFLGESYKPGDNSSAAWVEYRQEVLAMGNQIMSDITALRSNVTVLAEKMATFQQEGYVNDFLYAYVGGGYVDISDKFYSEYRDFHHYLQDENIDESQMNRAYNELYESAEKVEKFLHTFMTVGVLHNGQAITVQQLFYNTMGEDSRAYCRSLYDTYVLAQYSLQVCRMYQLQYCAENQSDYIVSEGNSFSMSGILERMVTQKERTLNVTEKVKMYLADDSLEHVFVKSPHTDYATPVEITTPINISSDCEVYMPVWTFASTNLFDADNFYFESSNPNCATVDENGRVKIHCKSGNFSIKLMYQYDAETAINCYEIKFSAFTSEEFSGGDGTKAAPFAISTPKDLKKLASDSKYWASNYYYILTNDIHVDNTAISQIGTLHESFFASFDGNGHTISGEQNHSLFGYNKGTIKNLTIQNAKVSDGGYQRYISMTVGGICTYNYGIIENVHFKDGVLDVDNTAAQNISAGGDSYYTAANLWIGGIAGENYGSIVKCSVSNSSIKGHQTNGTKKTSLLGVAIISAPESNRVAIGNITGYNGSLGCVEDCLAFDNYNYIYIKSVSGYAKNLWTSAEERLCTAYFVMGSLVGDNEDGLVDRCIAYSNTQDYEWVYATVNYVTLNKEKYIQAQNLDGINEFVGVGTKSHCYNSSAISSQEKQLMIDAGWCLAKSPYFDMTALEKYICLAELPRKLIYDRNETFNSAGLVLYVYNYHEYSDNEGWVAEGYTISGFDSSSDGEKNITVEWNGWKTTYKVIVYCHHVEKNVSHIKPGYYEVSCRICGETLYQYEDTTETNPDDGDPEIVIESKNISGGQTVDIQVDLRNNPGIAYLRATLVYDTSVLTLTNVKNGSVIKDFDAGENFMWSADMNTVANGSLVTLTFVIAEDAVQGDYAVSFLIRECYNDTYDNVALNVVDGVISVTDSIFGDVNGDGQVNGKDVLLLRKYMTNYNDDTQTSNVAISCGADANGDGKVNGKDLLLLRKYMANYNDDLGSSSVVLGPAA